MRFDGPTVAILIVFFAVLVGLLWDWCDDWIDTFDIDTFDDYWSDVDWKDEEVDDESDRSQSGKK